MATFTLTADTNIDALTGKTGGDTYNTAGFWLTIDQHSRFGLNQSNASDTTATSLGGLGSASRLKIDGTKVRMIPYTSGLGNVPTLNTLITIGGASGKLMCVYSADMTAVPKVAGEAMPTDGWIQVKQWNDVEYSAGVLTGISATCTGVSKVGILEIMVDTGVTWTQPQLDIKGEWYQLGTLDGTYAQTFQIPRHGTNCPIFGVFIETAVGSGEYEPYPNAKYGTNLNIGTEEARGKVCWLDRTTGVVRVGSNDGTTASGFTPQSGRKIVIPNLLLYSVATTLRRTAILTGTPHTINFDAYNTVLGMDVDKCNMYWVYRPSLYFYNDYKVANSSFYNTISGGTYKLGNTNTMTNCMLPRVSMFANIIPTSYNYCVFFQTVTPADTTTLATSNDVTFNNCTFQNTAVPALSAGLPTAISVDTAKNISFNNCNFIACRMSTSGTKVITFTNTGMCSVPFGQSVNPTVSLGRMLIFASSLASDITFDGLRLLVPNTSIDSHIIQTGNSRVSNIIIKNIGTFYAPLDFTSPYPTKALLYVIDNGQSDTFEIRDCYVTNMRSTLVEGSYGNYNGRVYNSGGSYADVNSLMYGFTNSISNGYRATLTSSTGVGIAADGFIATDCFDSTISGMIIFFPSIQADSNDKITLNGTSYRYQGRLYANVAGDGMIVEHGDYVIGHTGFKDLPIEMHTLGSAVVTNFTYGYSIDVNNGNGFSTMIDGLTASQLGTALSAITIDSAKGIKLKIKVIYVSGVSQINRILLRTNSSVDAQKIKYSNPVYLPTITINADTAFLSAGTGKFAMYLDDMVGYQYGVNTTPVLDSFSNPIQGTITQENTTFTFGFSSNMQGIRQKDEDTNVVVVATNPLYSQPIIVRGTITNQGLFISLNKLDDKAMTGGL